MSRTAAVTTASRGSTGAGAVARVADLFDEYRAHYGEPSPGALPWLTAQVAAGRLAVAAFVDGPAVHGLITTVVLPAYEIADRLSDWVR